MKQLTLTHLIFLLLPMVALYGCHGCEDIPQSHYYFKNLIRLTDTSHIVSVQFMNRLKTKTLTMLPYTKESALYFLGGDDVTRLIITHTSGIDTLDVEGKTFYQFEDNTSEDCGETPKLQMYPVRLSTSYSTFDSTNIQLEGVFSSTSTIFLLKP